MSIAGFWPEPQTLGEAASRQLFIALASSFDQPPISKNRVVSVAGNSINSSVMVSPEYLFISGVQVLPISSKHNAYGDSLWTLIVCTGSQEHRINKIPLPMITSFKRAGKE
jgi:hypothetical protein